MPYPQAHWFMLALLPVTVLAFWPRLWTLAVDEIATWSPIAVFTFGALLGAVACVLGWRQGETIERFGPA